MTSDLSPIEWPSVSIVIPVRNEEHAIGTAIESCLQQVYAGTIEIVVADGRSDDGTRHAVEAIGDLRVKLVDNVSGKTPAGLNAAIEASEGDVIVRCDAHARLPDRYVHRAVKVLLETGADNVGGVQKAVGTSLVQRAVALAMTSRIGVGNSRFHYGGAAGETDTVYLGVFRRDVFDRVGMFDESLVRNQDYELNHRIRAAGGVVYFDPALSVDYAPRRSFAALWRQYYQYGHWKYLVVRRHPNSLRFRQLAPPALILGLLGSIGLVGSRWSLLVPVGWLLALIVAAVWTGIAHRTVAAVLMPFAVAVMHLAWGIGFLGAAVRRLR